MQHPWEELYRFKQQIQYRIIDRLWMKNPPMTGGFKYRVNDRPLYGIKKAREIVEKTVQEDIGNYPLLNTRVEDITCNKEWNYDFANNVQGQRRFVHDIDAFDFSLGDYRYYYELGRLHWLPMFALMGVTKKPELIGKSKVMLREWNNQNPFLQTVAWQSANEVGIRAVNLIYYRRVLELCNEPVDDNTEKLLGYLIELHYRFITSHLSLFSSKGNHHVGEMMGVISICCTYQFKDSDKVLKSYFEELQNEIMRLIDKDGFDREQSSNYLTSYINLNLVAIKMAEQKGLYPRSDVMIRVKKMYEALDAIRVKHGEFFHVGDTDNAELLFPYMDNEYNIYESQLNDCVILFDGKRYGDYHFDLRNYLIFGDYGAEKYLNSELKEKSDIHELMADSGYFIIRDNAINLLFDVGRVGLWPQMCHGHADMLNVLLYYLGQPILVDCGCYQYNAYHKKFRDYFHGSKSHNVISINDKDQVQMGSGMFWLNDAKIVIDDSGENWCEAHHYGYKDAIHKRRVSYYDEKRIIEIKDTICPKSDIEIGFHLHFHPSMSVALKEGQLKIGELAIIENELISGGMLLRGDEEKPYGWFSERYGKKEITTSFLAKKLIGRETVLITTIQLCAES